MYWLLKSEPSAWSWQDQARVCDTLWDGVRNYQARNNMRSMKKGDLCFFYHSNIAKPAVVGVVQVSKTFEWDMHDPRFGHVTVSAVKALPRPVFLSWIKAHPLLQNIALVNQSRLSVMPFTEEEWQMIWERGHSKDSLQ